MSDLTAKQKAILMIIKDGLDTNGIIPTRREIMAKMNYTAPATVVHHLNIMERKGYISINPRMSRSIRILKMPQEESK